MLLDRVFSSKHGVLVVLVAKTAVLVVVAAGTMNAG
jgi:hypothetical protein